MGQRGTCSQYDLTCPGKDLPPTLQATLARHASSPCFAPQVHGRQRDLGSEDELRFGVTQEVLYARNRPAVEGAQWTGIVTQVWCGGPPPPGCCLKLLAFILSC